MKAGESPALRNCPTTFLKCMTTSVHVNHKCKRAIASGVSAVVSGTMAVYIADVQPADYLPVYGLHFLSIAIYLMLINVIERKKDDQGIRS
jgi:hypothetical protein